ncbi:MAG TPA: hypothetical protein PKK74_01945 [Candidatus Methanoculleus thermohydrogenotrophicum]|jgi:hypothetical protein|nr:hypothetical protein [Candidatus Methanoculleus thermohydrogenotrophicum]NLM82991.1 hypothetical protein [Candidatus Methanoculleus thermohydrogenotrophicum]HOB17447.1 hypothetical protein [Candidatus Methanoculleus thermohydrogenotrophicum]HPZ37565.1 hypothetical protein [Candidatus Methanoculleus thermohydrogenotrophicum]HQC90695.1 hypothetical protein [Candidatus Methanoculleus thermohydrogenotrophicum]
MPYKWLSPQENYRCGDVQVPDGSYRVSIKIEDDPRGDFSIVDERGVIVGTVTIQEVGDMCVLNWAIQGGTFTGDIAVKGGPSSFVYRYNGIQGRYPPLSPAEP